MREYALRQALLINWRIMKFPETLNHSLKCCIFIKYFTFKILG